VRDYELTVDVVARVLNSRFVVRRGAAQLGAQSMGLLFRAELDTVASSGPQRAGRRREEGRGL